LAIDRPERSRFFDRTRHAKTTLGWTPLLVAESVFFANVKHIATERHRPLKVTRSHRDLADL
jgi:hypothetical protein